MSDSVRPHRRQPTRLPCPWDSPGKNTGVGCHFLLQCMKVKVKSLSRVQLLVTPWTAAYQAPLSIGFSRQEYWSGVPSPSPSEAQNQCLMNYISVYVMILITKFQCVEGDFPTLSSTPQIPAGQPTTEFNSDIIHLERASDPTG